MAGSNVILLHSTELRGAVFKNLQALRSLIDSDLHEYGIALTAFYCIATEQQGVHIQMESKLPSGDTKTLTYKANPSEHKSESDMFRIVRTAIVNGFKIEVKPENSED